MLRRVAAATTCLFLLSIGHAAPVPKPSTHPLFFPTNVGARWVYSLTVGGKGVTGLAVIPVGSLLAGRSAMPDHTEFFADTTTRVTPVLNPNYRRDSGKWDYSKAPAGQPRTKLRPVPSVSRRTKRAKTKR